MTVARLIAPMAAAVMVALTDSAVGKSDLEKSLERIVAEEKQDRFELWNHCLPIDLAVGILEKDASKIGLTKDKLLTAVRSRLRAARLYSDQYTTLVRVNIHVVGPAFNISVRYLKFFKDDLGSEEVGHATTWAIRSTGTHGQDANYILSALSQHMDKFIDEYLRVNATACKR